MVVGRDEVGEVAWWGDGIEEVHRCIAGRFRRPEPRRRALAYLKGLLSPVERKNGWQLAEHLGDADGVLVVDETGFLKKGDKSAGVQRQYSGTAGRIENCQVGVFLAYAGARVRTLLGRELYLPQVWSQDRERRREAGVPEDAVFRTKGQLAQVMLGRALESGVPFAWFTGDEVYSSDRKLRLWLEREEILHVMAIKRNEKLWDLTDKGPTQARADELACRFEEPGWTRCNAGSGAKGPRIYDWAAVDIRPLREPGKGYWLLARRSIAKPGELAYYVCFGQAGTNLEELVRVAGTRWAIEECFEEAKGESLPSRRRGWVWTSTRCGGGIAGTGTSPPCPSTGQALAMLAHAYLAVIRNQAVEGEEKGATTARMRN